MSEFSDFKAYVASHARTKGHGPGPWHWAPFDNTPAHESIGEDCGGRLHLFWDREEMMWLADGDLIDCNCSSEGRQ